MSGRFSLSAPSGGLKAGLGAGVLKIFSMAKVVLSVCFAFVNGEGNEGVMRIFVIISSNSACVNVGEDLIFASPLQKQSSAGGESSWRVVKKVSGDEGLAVLAVGFILIGVLLDAAC